MDTADAVVIGGGVMGTSIAFNLARRKAGRVVLLEKNSICSGTSAKSSAIVRTHYTIRSTAVMALLARRIFENFRDEVGGDCGFVKTGMLFIGDPEAAADVRRTLEMNQALGIEARLVTRDEVGWIDPPLAVPEAAPMVYEPHSGYGSPHEMATSYARAFVERGGEVRQSTPVTGIDVSGGRVCSVRTPRGEVATRHAVIAAGPWASDVGRLAGLHLPVVAARQSVIVLRPRRAPEGPCPVVADLANGVYLRPETGNLILVGSTRDNEVPGDPDSYEDRPGVDVSAALVERLSRLMPAAADFEIVGGWSGMYEISPDWNPIMGSASSVAGLHYAVGFSGHGFKLSPIVGALMAEHVLEGRASTLDLTPYRLERFAEGRELRPAYSGAGVIG